MSKKKIQNFKYINADDIVDENGPWNQADYEISGDSVGNSTFAVAMDSESKLRTLKPSKLPRG